MKPKLPLFVWAALVSIVLIASSSAVRFSPDLISKSYVDSDGFHWQMEEFYEKLSATRLNPIDIEEAKMGLSVSIEEIDAHRTRYGTLAEQLANIHDQYQSRIIEAQESGNKVLESTLISERDKKVEDIQKNFEDDEHIGEKIKNEKVAHLERYLKEVKEDQTPDFPIAYKLKDVETGEEFLTGETSVPAVYKKEFNSESGFLKAKSIPYDHDLFYIQDLSIQELSEMENPNRTFEGTVIIPKTALLEGAFSEQVKDHNKTKYRVYTFWILGLVSLVILVMWMKFKKEWVTGTRFAARYNNLKIEVKAALLFVALMILSIYLESVPFNLLNILSSNRLGRWGLEFTTFIFCGVFVVSFIAFQLVNMVERWKQKGLFEKDLADSYIARFLVAIQEMFLNTKIGFQMFVLLVGFFSAGLGFAGVVIFNELILIYIPLVLFIGLPFLYIFVRRTAYLNRIIIATEAMAAGQLHEPIKVQGKSPLAEHAKNLNNLREGVRTSMTEQAKSERLKTELITNVSHDLRTPLTSIITYTDLLKTKDLTEEERMKYVDVLDKKSQRLKTLIEDLFEVSKMASGNLELTKNRVDLTQLLQQALAEHAEGISETGLDFRVNLPEAPLVAHVDGQRWWRVLDNLIVNTIKYTLPGTRVYITLQRKGENAQFILKNISKYEIGENVDELFERFKRADTSRHTDGSGLGLAIAQSIVDMHEGTMKIEIDGDLFKVTVTVPTV